MYGKLCYKSSTLKNEKSKSNVNISKIPHSLFGIFCYSFESMMVRCKMH